jgi:RNA polymerase-binding transcription factor DksA
MTAHTYKVRLESMLEDITKELQTVGIHDPHNIQDWVATPDPESTPDADANVSADNLEDFEERSSLVATLETRYNNIVRALKKIEDNTFGTCEICNAPIEEKRLDANPAARTCIAHIEEPVQ